MQISRITNFITSANRHFLQSSWKGKTVQILCAVSFLSLIYFVAFRPKKKQPLSSDPVKLPGRVSVKSKAHVVEPFKVDLSYIKTTTAVPDFLTNEFGQWLSERVKDCDKWITWTKGSSIQQSSCPHALKHFIPELKAEVEKMIPLFKAHPEVKTEDWAAFFQDCDTIADRKADPVKSCEKLQACLTKLQSWDASVQSLVRTKFLEQASHFPHYDFTNLQTQYFHYLGLHSDTEFSRLLETERCYLPEVGLLEMADVDLLQLRALQPSIEKLRQLFCSWGLTGNEEVLRSLIHEEIQKCTANLDQSNSLSDDLNNGPELKDNLKILRELFSQLKKSADGLSILKQIEKQDIVRQLLQLKGYIHQQNNRQVWKKFNTMGFTRLALYAQVHELKAFLSFYLLTQENPVL